MQPVGRQLLVCTTTKQHFHLKNAMVRKPLRLHCSASLTCARASKHFYHGQVVLVAAAAGFVLDFVHFPYPFYAKKGYREKKIQRVAVLCPVKVVKSHCHMLLVLFE